MCELEMQKGAKTLVHDCRYDEKMFTSSFVNTRSSKLQ